MTRVPLRGLFEWALLLPLAVPAYVMAYVYYDLLAYAGPVQTWLRDLFGWGRDDYVFPDISSLYGAVLVMGFVLYPYVYLLSRAAFLQQSVGVLEAGRILGGSPTGVFLRLGVPMARPAIAAGAALVAMETLADYGTVTHLGVPTFTTGIYRTWFASGAPVAAAQLAAVLLATVAVVLVAERLARGRARFHEAAGRMRPTARLSLSPGTAVLAVAACAVPVLVGFVIPAAVLLDLAVRHGDPMGLAAFAEFARNSFSLAALTSVLAVGLGLLLAYAQRMDRTPATRVAVRCAGLGYAIPGAVIAVGVLVPFAALDNALDALAREVLGVSTGLVLTGTIAALVFAYLVRFLAVALGAAESGLNRVSPSLDEAARTLGAGPGRTLLSVHLPLLRGGLLTAAILVFVDVMKELPATLIVRPFNFETLAVRAHRLASDALLEQASTASLTIVLVGIAPVILVGEQNADRLADSAQVRVFRGQ
ncbi:ABC transporter permease [Roseospira visakhapatnamensis]|uniref:Iron(III) transport system permease protein n=1 Tax=Roseospira visakhapatnamensis TaxID=390880 RepID=A0A7W6RGR5_9PROT|nr:iron ABC transporter permease [Roseospira visakhapatnamensis]MBB4268017.1 iron(III) transport system permease protein [Roseospira visakhapatnamensis]